MQEAKDRFYDTDGLDWNKIIDQKNYTQWEAFPPGCNGVSVMKVRTRLSIPMYAALDNLLVWDLRGKWEKTVKERKDFEIAPDCSYLRYY